MCGISGIFEFDQSRPVAREAVSRMNESLRHRGPDDEGIYLGMGIGLGHRRLSIIDVAGGRQPISNEDETVWVLLNGEIYNYASLRQELMSYGHKFATKSDTEAIVHLYEQYGEECFARLRGMFAIAIWDSKQRRLLLARDRVGKKPLYYFADKKQVIFGSELKAILAADSVSRTTDPLALSDYFSFSYIPAPKTIYKHIRKLQPAHYLIATSDGLIEKQYWNLSFSTPQNHTEAEWCERIRHQLCDATRVRLMSEVPIGAFLSGGLDSSSVVALMSH
jgi:asparagine synthase (glutamine-hydrolysing)